MLTFTLTGVYDHAVVTPQGTAYTISMPEGTPLLRKGYPDLPKMSTMLMIPATGNMSVEIVDASYDDIQNVQIAPSKGDLKRTVDPDKVPYTYSPAYAEDAFYPAALTSLQTPFIQRDVRGVALWIQPVQYNPVSKTLRVYHSLKIRVYNSGGTGKTN